MADLMYSALVSLDGYVEDSAGNFDWAAPDEELLAFVNELEVTLGTNLYGRRMYETMLYWETADFEPGQPQVVRDLARLWQAAEKIVYSRTMSEVRSRRTRLERNFSAAEVRRLKAAANAPLSVGGAALAGQAIAAGLVDEFQLFVTPVIVGSGKPWLPQEVAVDVSLLDTRRFQGGVVYLRYRVN